MNNFSEKATELFMQGYSCSESVVMAAYETGLIDKDINPHLLNSIASPFSGAMGTHKCLCGAVAGSQIVLGLVFGRKDPKNDPHKIRKIARDYINKFKEKRNVESACCSILRGDCINVVRDAAAVANKIIEEKRSLV